MKVRGLDLIPGAMKLVEECAKVRSGEVVLIVTDTAMMNIAYYVGLASQAKKAETVFAIMTPRGKHHEEPPRPIGEAIKNADVVFTPTTFSLAHSLAIENALKAGVRVVLMTQYTVDLLTSDALLKANFRELGKKAEKFARVFVGDEAKITTKAGTDLTFSIKGRKPNIMRGTFIDFHGMEAPPDVEVNIAPVEGSANGKIVIDGAVGTLGCVDQPIEIAVRDGLLKPDSISVRDDKARWLKETLLSFKDPNVCNIGEIAFGLNPFARLGKHLIENEGALGTGHIGIGTSVLGGRVRTDVHIDVVYKNPTLEVNGRVLIDNGKFLV